MQSTTHNTIGSIDARLRPYEAAKFLKISERTLFKLTKSGAIPAQRVGRQLRYTLQDLASIGKPKGGAA